MPEPYNYYTPIKNPLENIEGILRLEQLFRRSQEQNALRRYLSGGADLETPEGLQGLMRVAPELGLRVQQAIAERNLTRERMASAEAERQVKKARLSELRNRGLAGAAMSALNQYEQAPEEQRDRLWPDIVRSSLSPLVASGLIPEGFLPELPTPQQARAFVGAGFAPGQQAQAQLGQQRLEQQGEYQLGMLGLRAAELAQQREYQRARIGQASAAEAGRQKRFEQRLAQGEDGTTISYDSQGNPVIQIGGRRKLTEQEQKYTVYATAGQQAQDIMESLSKKFDPTTIKGTAELASAGSAFTNFLSSKEGRQYRAAQERFKTIVGYALSGQNIPEAEMEAAKDVYIDKLGDDSETKLLRKQMRQILLDAMRAGSSNVGAIAINLADQYRMRYETGADPSRFQIAPGQTVKEPRDIDSSRLRIVPKEPRDVDSFFNELSR